MSGGNEGIPCPRFTARSRKRPSAPLPSRGRRAQMWRCSPAKRCPRAALPAALRALAPHRDAGLRPGLCGRWQTTAAGGRRGQGRRAARPAGAAGARGTAPGEPGKGPPGAGALSRGGGSAGAGAGTHLTAGKSLAAMTAAAAAGAAGSRSRGAGSAAAAPGPASRSARPPGGCHGSARRRGPARGPPCAAGAAPASRRKLPQGLGRPPGSPAGCGAGAAAGSAPLLGAIGCEMRIPEWTERSVRSDTRRLSPRRERTRAVTEADAGAQELRATDWFFPRIRWLFLLLLSLFISFFTSSGPNLLFPFLLVVRLTR